MKEPTSLQKKGIMTVKKSFYNKCYAKFNNFSRAVYKFCLKKNIFFYFNHSPTPDCGSIINMEYCAKLSDNSLKRVSEGNVIV